MSGTQIQQPYESTENTSSSPSSSVLPNSASVATVDGQPNGQSMSLSPTVANDLTTISDSRISGLDTTTTSTTSSSSPEQLGQQRRTTGPIRVPGTYPPEWLPDHETDSCMSCDSSFTLIKRRHHCRSCGKIFCGECCRQKAKLLYLDNKEARVCSNCFWLIEYTLSNHSDLGASESQHQTQQQQNLSPSTSSREQTTIESNPSSTNPKVHGVLKTGNQSRTNVNNECNTSLSSSSDQQSNKQVMFADGIRPGTDLSEPFPYPVPSSSSSSNPPSASFSLLTRQNRGAEGSSTSTTTSTPSSTSSSKKNKSNKSQDSSYKNITVCDEIGYLPPIVISKHSTIAKFGESSSTSNSSSNSLTNLIASQFRLLGEKRTIQSSMESRSCPLNGVVKFEEISDLVGIDGVITFLLLKDFYLRVKLVTKDCCIDKKFLNSTQPENDSGQTLDAIEQQTTSESKELQQPDDLPIYWCFTSEGLARFGQNEIVLIIDKETGNSCLPRDVFKVYLTLHELALRRQSLENLGNLLFQDGLFGNRDTAGLLFVRPLECHCVKNLVLPTKSFLVALVLQRWEVPWSKVFPMRLLLRLGHKFGVYPYPIVSFRARDPVYYEVGHTIISILGDFRNFRYSMTHVDGLKVMLNKKTRKVLIQLNQSCYQQFNKVLDSSNNEHVLAWSSCPFPEADGHLVSVQNEDGQYETVEFYKRTYNLNIPFDELDVGEILGASFVIFSGALKVNQSGQSAKISIVEDGLLIQIQSCTMSALKNAIHFMHHFDIDCENNQDPLNRVELDWQTGET